MNYWPYVLMFGVVFGGMGWLVWRTFFVDPYTPSKRDEKILSILDRPLPKSKARKTKKTTVTPTCSDDHVSYEALDPYDSPEEPVSYGHPY